MIIPILMATLAVATLILVAILFPYVMSDEKHIQMLDEKEEAPKEESSQEECCNQPCQTCTDLEEVLSCEKTCEGKDGVIPTVEVREETPIVTEIETPKEEAPITVPNTENTVTVEVNAKPKRKRQPRKKKQ